QAEDGIRDFHVTGVQTCALPIWTGTSRDSRGVAQLGSASRSGREGRRFKSYHPDFARFSAWEAGFFYGHKLSVFRVVKRRSMRLDRKSTRLNSSHVKISYAVFCL